MFRFQDPAYLYLLILLPILVGFYFYTNFRRKQRIRKYGDPALLKDLMPDVSTWKPHLKFWLLFAAFALMIIILARPQFGSKMETVKKKGSEVMIAMDISNSMLAQDVQPSRLEKAKRLVSQLVDKMDNDKVGMIIFAGDAYTQVPITNDFLSAKMFLNSVDPSLISRQGTAIGKAIQLATRSFTNKEGVGKAIVLITDGENLEGDVKSAIKQAEEKGIQVDVIGVGLPEGAPIPINGTNEYKKDAQGNVVITKLNEDMCKEIAQEGHGIYVRLDNTNNAEKAINNAIANLSKADVESQVYSEYNEQFQYIAWLVLVLLLVELLFLNRKNMKFNNIHLFSNRNIYENK